jgi:hypothetical protein
MFDYFVSEYIRLRKERLPKLTHPDREARAERQRKRCDIVDELIANDEKFGLDKTKAYAWLSDCCKTRIAHTPWWVEILKYFFSAAVILATARFATGDKPITTAFALFEQLVSLLNTIMTSQVGQIVLIAIFAIEYALLRKAIESIYYGLTKEKYADLLSDVSYAICKPRMTLTTNITSINANAESDAIHQPRPETPYLSNTDSATPANTMPAKIDIKPMAETIESNITEPSLANLDILLT